MAEMNSSSCCRAVAGSAADVVANRIRHDVFSGTQDFDYAMQRLAVAIGVAAAPEDGHELRILFRKAVRNLRKEKQARQSRGDRRGDPVPAIRALSIRELLLVASGGAVGSAARYAVSGAAQRLLVPGAGTPSPRSRLAR